MSGIMYVLCEGHSENAFVNSILSPYIGEQTKWKTVLKPITLITSEDHKRGIAYRGGVINYDQVVNNLSKCFGYGRPVTTMFDLFRLPNDFPGVNESVSINRDADKAKYIENRIKEDLKSRQFIFRWDWFFPYLQVHEFEALFYCNLLMLKDLYLSEDDQRAIDILYNCTKDIPPEDVNNGEDTAPSKRLMDAINYRKGQSVTITLKKIGIDVMREKCPHFDEWVRTILECMS